MTRAPEAIGPTVFAYAALRRGGAPPTIAQAQLGLASNAGARLEAAFCAKVARGGGEAQPRFARHAAHVAAVLAQGGFPSLSERRVGKASPRVGLPLVWPEQRR
jgi:hypothetical protein